MKWEKLSFEKQQPYIEAVKELERQEYLDKSILKLNRDNPNQNFMYLRIQRSIAKIIYETLKS